MKAAIYIRIATADQLSNDFQQEEMKRYAKEKGYDVAVVFPLVGVTGAETTPYIEELKQTMIEQDIRKLLACNPSRVSRDPFLFMVIDEMFRKSGIELEYLPLFDISMGLTPEYKAVLDFLMDEMEQEV
jgi:resolvase, N domain protein